MWEDLFRNPLHLITLLAMVMLIFGGRRVAEVGGSLGKGIREFKKEIRDDGDDSGKRGVSPVSSEVTVKRTCGVCGAANASAARFCIGCGQALSMPMAAAQCPSCHAEVAPTSRFCNKCGHEVATTGPRAEGVRAT